MILQGSNQVLSEAAKEGWLAFFAWCIGMACVFGCYLAVRSWWARRSRWVRIRTKI
jgi:hypothetical protein